MVSTCSLFSLEQAYIYTSLVELSLENRKAYAGIWEIVREVYLFHRYTPIPCSHLPLVEEAWKHFRHLECSTGGIQEADTGLESHKIPVPTAAGECDPHWDFLWIQQCCSKRGEKGEEQAPKECPLTTSHSTKAPKQKPTKHIFPEVRCRTLSDRKRGTKNHNTPVFSVSHQGNCCRTNKSRFFQFVVLDSTKQSKVWPKASYFLVITILLQIVARANASSTPFQFFDKGY